MSSASPSLLHTQSIGSGAHGVVLLHGFLGSGRNLRTLAQRWADLDPSLHFVIADLRGHGQSPPLPEAGADLAALATDVHATVAAAGMTPPYSIVGHSLGGRVGLAAAGLFPEAIAEVSLLDITPGPIDAEVSESRRVLDLLLEAPQEAADRAELRRFFVGRGLTPGLSDWLLMNLVNQGGRVRWAIDRAALDRLHGTTLRQDLWDVVEAGRVPLRCVRGGRSRYVSDADVRRLVASGVPTATLPDAGHFVHVDDLTGLLAWLTGGEPSTAVDA